MDGIKVVTSTDRCWSWMKIDVDAEDSFVGQDDRAESAVSK